LADSLRYPRRFPVTSLRLKSDGSGHFEKPSELGGFSCATFRDDHRAKADVELATAVGLDLEGSEFDLDDAVMVLQANGLSAVVYTSFNYGKHGPRLRAIVPFSRPVTPNEYPVLFAHVSGILEEAGARVDPVAKDASRFWFAAGVPEGADYQSMLVDGAPLDVDRILAEADSPSRAAPLSSVSLNGDRRDRYAAGALRRACETIGGAAEGTRNATLNKEAFAIARYVAAGELDELLVRDQLDQAAAASGLGAAEIRATLDSAFRAGTEHPRNIEIGNQPQALTRREPHLEKGAVESEGMDVAEVQAPAIPYSFRCPVDNDHFLARFINYASSRTDAAHEYHEASGLTLIGGATLTVRAHLSPYPSGLPTNLYVLFVGDSTTSRKSTSKDLARDAQARGLPGSLSPDHFSPEAFVEHLASRPHNSTTLYVDEFGELLDKLHHAKHMAGLRGLWMTVYAGADYTYRRHSKRGGSGAKVVDEDRIEGPHLGILGATTPAIFEVLAETDVISGLLPRFAIIMPDAKPPRRPFFEIGDDTEQERSRLVSWLNDLHEWSTSGQRRVLFGPEVLDTLDAFGASIEADAPNRAETAKAMLQRLTPMVVKVAMLIAAGRPETLGGAILTVRAADAKAAIEIGLRWKRDALAFVERVGESDFERRLGRCLKLLQSKRKALRRDIARHCHTDKRTLDMIQDTLVDRGQIRVIATPVPGRPTLIEWETV